MRSRSVDGSDLSASRRRRKESLQDEEGVRPLSCLGFPLYRPALIRRQPVWRGLHPSPCGISAEDEGWRGSRSCRPQPARAVRAMQSGRCSLGDSAWAPAGFTAENASWSGWVHLPPTRPELNDPGRDGVSRILDRME